MTDHPITPPPELMEQWRNEWIERREPSGWVGYYIAIQAARWGADQQLKLDADQIAQAYQAGADQELEACCEWVAHILDMPGSAICLREDRRRKPSSLKEQALALLDKAEDPSWDINDFSIVRKALEQLDD